MHHTLNNAHTYGPSYPMIQVRDEVDSELHAMRVITVLRLLNPALLFTSELPFNAPADYVQVALSSLLAHASVQYSSNPAPIR